MINKITTMENALDSVKSGDRVMIGGFGLSGSPLNLIRGLSKKPVKNLTAISEDIGYSNVTIFKDRAVSALYDNRQVSKVCVSFLGPNKFINQLIKDGELEYQLVPQGTLIERIRAAAAGIGGFYTPTGVGTVVEEGKEKKVIDGREYILETALHAEVALVKGYRADRMGNVTFRYTGSNFNLMMAMAAKTTIVEVEEIVEVGELDPEHVQLPGVFVDYVVLPEGGA